MPAIGTEPADAEEPAPAARTLEGAEGAEGTDGVERLRWMAAIVDGSDDTIITAGLDGIILSWNPAAERLYGYRADEAVGRSIKIIEPPEIRGDVDQVISAVAEGPHIHHYETVRMSRDGRRIDMALTLSPVRNSEGETVAVSAIGHDITEQRRLWRRHADERAYNRALIEASLDGMVTVGPDLRIHDLNRRMENLTGAGRGELIGTSVGALFSNPAAAEAALRRVLSEGQVSDFELVIRHRGGQRTPVSCNGTTYTDTAGNLQGAFIAARDVTLRKRAQEEVLRLNAELEDRVRIRTSQLQRSNRDLESFAYSVAHDLRTPLRAMTGFSELLVAEYGEVLGEGGRHYADRIREAGRRMANLIDDLLRLSRVSRAELRKEMVDLSAVARSVLARMQARNPERTVAVQIQEGIRAPADRGLIRDLLEQLFDNAWKFTAKQGDAQIEFASVGSPSDELCCVVRDNGAGFDPAYLERLYMPFQRLHSEREYPGTGVGLAGVRRIVEHHGGRTWAEGQVGKGASFYFTLPLQESRASPGRRHWARDRRESGPDRRIAEPRGGEPP